MSKLFLGQNSSGKTTNVKSYIRKLEGKVVVLDFNDEYDDFSDNSILLDDINPLLGKLSLRDAVALNAGYLHDSRCLCNNAEEVLKEKFRNMAEFNGRSFQEVKHDLEKEGLIDEALDRLHTSWNTTENMYAKILSQKIPLKRNKKQHSLDKALEKIKECDRILIKSKSLHSDHLRAVTFALLSRVSKHAAEPVHVVGDELSSFFNNGNIKLFAGSIDFSILNFVLCFNKASNVPLSFIPQYDSYFIHRFESNSDLKELKQFGIDVRQNNFKKLDKGKYITYDLVTTN